MDDFVKESLLRWISVITDGDVDFIDGEVLNSLIDLSGAVLTVTAAGCYKDRIESFLNATFHSSVADLFDIDGAISGKTNDLEIFGLCLTVLLGCLQSPCRQSFMDAALELSLDMQSAIFHLIQVPMTQLSLHHEFTRDLVLNRLLDPLPCIQTDVILPCHQTAITCQIEEGISEPLSKAASSTDISNRQNAARTDNRNSNLSVNSFGFEFTRPTSPTEYVNRHANKLKGGPDHQRPNNLSLCNTPDQSLCITSRLNSTDNSDHTHHMPSHLVSPLTSLKCLLDSPSLIHKTKLRESEREKRRLVVELEKERACRDEAESLVSGLRQQLEEASIKATESESRALRLSRELTALHDQGDELAHCRSELALREEEIKNLKQRVIGFQDLMAHLRKLEMEKIDLQQEREDLRLKVDQLLGQLKDFKERRVKCSEIEELKSKLRDVEAQLVQQLHERELIEKDKRRQHEMMLSQLKMQHSEKTHHPNNESSSVDQLKNNVEEIEYDEQVSNSHISNENTLQVNRIVDKEPQLDNSCQELSILKHGENLGAVLEDDLKSARLFISKLQLQFDEELGSARQLLEEKTKRLSELEQIVSARLPLVETTDVTTQTEMSCSASATSPDELLSPELLPTLADYAYSAAAAADRRGLSNELVRLHEEIAESKSYARELEQRLAEIKEELCSTKDKLIYQTTLSNRNQQNWIMIEQEYRELQRQHRILQNDLLSYEENHSRSSEVIVDNKTELESVRMSYEKEIGLLNQQLLEATFECRRLEAERSRVSLRNSDLQRELETTRILVDSLKRNSECCRPTEYLNYHTDNRKSAPNILSNTHLPSSIPNSDCNRNGTYEINGSKVNHQRCLDDSIEDWEVNEPDGKDNINFSQSHQIRSSAYPYEIKDTSNYRNNSSEGLNYTKRKKRHTKLRTDSKQLNRLASRTQELEEFAIRLREQFNQIISEEEENSENQPSTQVNTSVGVYPNLTGDHHNQSILTTIPLVMSKNHRQLNGCTNNYEFISEEYDVDDDDEYGEQDTDADSLAYTDLSQVSPVSQPADSRCQNNTKLTKDNFQSNTSLNSQPLIQHHSQSVGLMSSTVLKNSKSSPPLSSELWLNDTGRRLSETIPFSWSFDPNRLKELHLRNRLQPSHLRSSYPIETQVINSNDIVDTLSQMTTADNDASYLPNRIKANSRKTHRNDNNNSHNKESSEGQIGNDATSRTVPSSLSNDHQKSLRIKSMQENHFESESTASPLAAGYQPLPKDIQSFSEALISASVDIKAMHYVPTTHPKLMKSVITDKDSSSSSIQNVNIPASDKKMEFRNGNTNCTKYKMHESKGDCTTVNSPSCSGISSDNENVNPPSFNNKVCRRITDADVFVKPLNPIHSIHRTRKVDVYSIPSPVTNTRHNNGVISSTSSSVQSVDDLSGASSIRSNKSSIAFEIKNDQKTSGRRLPPTRLSSSQQITNITNTKSGDLRHSTRKLNKNFNCKSAFSASNLTAATTVTSGSLIPH
ncbi:rab6-interacting protein 2 (ERC protein 1) [Schistosoma japonicum]|nr:rab6-interacting protein 2 (ERC protein 1) [Schistosoma japonicum]